MDPHRLIRQDGDVFYTTAAGADPGLGVPCCPDWNVADLVWHLGEVHWFWASDIELRATSPDQVRASRPNRPEKYPQLIEWGRSQLDRLLQVLEATPDDAPAWTWGMDESFHNAGFIRRHQVQETGVHRWDMQSAASEREPHPIDPEAAADAIDEFLSVSLPFGVTPSKPLSGSVHLHCTDVAGEWFIEPKGNVDRAHARGDVAVRGTASDLLLALYNRIPIESLDVIGNESVARHLVERVDTE
ncbi:MAG TPA: maleylpyruvate isomerase family mycothiol-dependent enzyme [Acidimicrobiales bacterium]|nr:maleylpyruvate isomerase family mycothiol-dependent enzyme [Acidimicrobiales bacterium]